VTPRVRTCGIRTSPLVLLVSSQRILQVATTPRSRGQRHSPPSSLCLARSSSSPCLRRCFGELARSHLGIFDRVTPPSAPPALPASPHHRRHIGCGCRASVSPHCLLRRELTSSKLRRGHRCRGLGCVVHHFFSFLFLKLRLVMLMLVEVLFHPVSDQRRRRSAVPHRCAAIREGNVLRVR